jgi:putative inorganic carbon (HCO3(-)) transporter
VISDARAQPTSTTAVILVMLAIVGMAVMVLGTGSLIPALASLAAVAVLVAAAVRVDLALLVLVATAPLENALQVGDNPLLTLTKVAGFLTFFGFAVNAVATRRRIEISWTHGVVVALLLLALVSTVQARDENLALVTTFRYASFVALYFVISQMARDHRLLRRLVWALSLVAALAGVLGLRAYISGEAFAAVTPGSDPNDDAFGWITVLPLTLWLFTTTGRRARVLLVAMVATMITASLYSLSRGALLGLAAGIVWEILVERRQVRLFVGAAVAALVASIVVLNVNPQQLRISLLGKQKVAAHNVEARLDAWGAAADLAVREPVLGIGPGNFGLYYGEETGKPPGAPGLGVVHNAYLDLAAELGVGGLLLFVAYLVGSFRQLSEARGRGAGPPGLAAAARTSLVMASVAALTLSEQYFQPFWLLGGIGAALWAEARARDSALAPA